MTHHPCSVRTKTTPKPTVRNHRLNVSAFLKSFLVFFVFCTSEHFYSFDKNDNLSVDKLKFLFLGVIFASQKVNRNELQVETKVIRGDLKKPHASRDCFEESFQPSVRICHFNVIRENLSRCRFLVWLKSRLRVTPVHKKKPKDYL